MRKGLPTFARTVAIQRVRERLMRDSFPRTQMAFIVALTGGFGLLSSFAMLQLGVDSMAIRYPLALTLAYLFFLVLIWLWLRTKAEDYLDTAEAVDLIPRPRIPSGGHEFKSGGGGDFAGAGGGGSFEAPIATLQEATESPLSTVGESVSSAADADELAIPLIAVALAVGIALASLYVIYVAPVLLAEVLVDGALSYGLFRHLRGQDTQHWLTSTIRRTALPFLVTAVFLLVVGAAMAAYAPGAKSVGQFIKHANEKSNPR